MKVHELIKYLKTVNQDLEVRYGQELHDYWGNTSAVPVTDVTEYYMDDRKLVPDELDDDKNYTNICLIE